MDEYQNEDVSEGGVSEVDVLRSTLEERDATLREVKSTLEERDATLERVNRQCEKLGLELQAAETRELRALQLAADWYEVWQRTPQGRLVFATEEALQTAEQQGRIQRRQGGA